jgi:hypothetical protein
MSLPEQVSQHLYRVALSQVCLLTSFASRNRSPKFCLRFQPDCANGRDHASLLKGGAVVVKL